MCGGAGMPDVLSQGSDRERSPWPRRRLAAVAVVAVLAVVIVAHLPGRPAPARHSRPRHSPAAAAAAPLPLAAAARNLPAEPDGVIGRTRPGLAASGCPWRDSSRPGSGRLRAAGRQSAACRATGTGISSPVCAAGGASGAFSPDGSYLALQVSEGAGGDGGELAMQLEVASVSGCLAVDPRTRASSDALAGFGWPAPGGSLVAELRFTTKVQVTSWQPGARKPAVAAVSPRRTRPR